MTKGYFLEYNKLPVGKLVGVTHINKREDIEALDKTELVNLCCLLHNNFIKNL